MSGLIRSEARGEVSIITIDAPARRNAISAGMRDALTVAFDTAFSDAACRAIVLTGAGEAFCAGFDVGEMSEGDDVSLTDLRDRLERLHTIVARIAAGPKPVVCAVEGVAAGAGLAFAAASDFVVAGEGASFVASWTKLGLLPDCGAVWSLPRRVGPGFARDMMFSGRRVGHEEAHAAGLVDQLTARGASLEQAITRAATYGAAAPLAIARTKAILAELQDADLASALEAEIVAQGPLKETHDHAEARRAFLEKRPPVFRGE